MKSARPLNSYPLISTTFVFLLSFSIFWGFHYFGIRTDIPLHIGKVIGIFGDRMNFGANFLYYLTLYLAGLLVGSGPTNLYLAATFILSIAVSAKYLITLKFLMKYGGDDSFIRGYHSFFAVALIFVFSVPLVKFFGGYYYRGNTPPNVWHNSTTIFLMPFALMLFWKSYEQLVNPTNNRIKLLTVLTVLNIIIKPSYCFVFIVAYPVLLLKCFWLSKRLWLNLIPVFTAVSLVAIQYLLLFVFGLSQTGFNDSSKVIISIFEVWSSASPNIPVSLLGALLFPIAYICLYFKDARRDLLMQYSVVGHLVALTIYSLFIETGSRQLHGNFGWQCMVTSYMLYMSVTARFIKKLNESECKDGFNLVKLSIKNKIILSVFCLHLISGLIYIVRIFILKNYF